MSRVLYLSASNPITPRVGMDMVSAEHVRELALSGAHDITYIAVAPGLPNQPPEGAHDAHGAKVKLFVGDLLTEPGGLKRVLNKLGMLARHAVPVMAYSFKSKAATDSIRQLLKAERFDKVIVDHFYTLANVRLKDLKQCGAEIIYISHDAMLPHITEMAAMKHGFITKLYYRFEALRAHWGERQLFKMSGKVVHLSEYERKEVAGQDPRHIALLPMLFADGIDHAKLDATELAKYKNTVMFVGSPAHPPNAHALAWIVETLAPSLQAVAPHLCIALVGGGTEKLVRADRPNVQGLGFVSNSQMQHMLAGAICALSPVVKGHGIKVKVLEAIAAGCPVMAAKESLRGFEAFGIEAAMLLSQPQASAEAIAALARSDQAMQAARKHMRDAWQTFAQKRKGQLAALLN